MNRMTRIAALALAIAPALAFGQAATWNIDGSHTRTGFSVKHLVISDVKGEFAKSAVASGCSASEVRNFFTMSASLE